jgi:hypothetical protein
MITLYIHHTFRLVFFFQIALPSCFFFFETEHNYSIRLMAQRDRWPSTLLQSSAGPLATPA